MAPRLSFAATETTMNHMFKNFKWAAAAMAVLSFSSQNADAQHAMGLVVGDYNQPYKQFLNPAEIRSPLHKNLFINWYGNSIQYNNNFMDQPAPYRYLGRWGQPSNTGVSSYNLNYLNETYGFSITVPLDREAGLTFGFRGVSGYNVNGLTPTLGNTLIFGKIQLAADSGKSFTTGAFSVNTDKYQEYYMGFGSYAFDGSSSMEGGGWRWGANAKLLIGNGSMSLNSTGMDYTVNGPNSVTINKFDGNFNYSDLTSAANTLRSPWGMKFDFTSGVGAGMDLGFVYESRNKVLAKWPDGYNNCKIDQYMMPKFRFGVSVTDLGFISYDGGTAYQSSMRNAGLNWNIDTALFIQGNTAFESTENKIKSVESDVFMDAKSNAVASNHFVSYTPAALNIQTDFRLNFNWHFSAYLTKNLKPADAPGLRRTSYISFIPRYETKNWEFGFPMTALGEEYENGMLGAYVRFGPVTVGTNDLAGLGTTMRKEPTHSSSFYVALRSRIGDCGRNYRYYNNGNDDYAATDSTVVDTAAMPATPAEEYFKRDTVFVEKLKRDTIIVRDTVKVNQAAGPALTEALNKLKACETAKIEALKGKVACDQALTEAKLKATEADKKAAEAMTKNKACENELVVLKDKCKKDADIAATEALKNKQQVDNQKKKIDSLMAEIAKKNAVITAKEVKENQLNDEINRLKNTQGVPCDKQMKLGDSLLAVERLKNQTVAAELSKTKSLLTASEAKNLEKDKQILDLQNKLLEAQKAKLASDNKVLDLQKQLTTLGEQNAINKKCCDDKTAELNAEKAKNATLTAEVNNLKNQVTALQNTKASLEERLKNQIACEDCTPYKTKAAALEKDLAAANAKIAAMAAEKKACEDKLTVAQNTITSLNATIAKLLAEKKACEDKLAAATGTSTGEDCTPYKNRITALEKELATTKASLDAEVAKGKALEQKLAGCIDKATLDKALADLDAANKKAADLDAKLKASEAAKAKALADLDAANKTIADLQEKLKNCGSSTTSSCDCDALNAQIAQLKLDLQSKQNAYDAIMAEYQDCLNTTKTLKSQLKDCQDKLSAGSSTAAADLQAAKDEISKLKSTIAQLNSELANANASIADLNEQLKTCDSNTQMVKDQLAAKTAEASNLLARLRQMEAQLNDCNAKLKKCLESAPPAPADSTGGN